MPYSGPADTSLPSNVKKLDTKQRRQWVSVFNSAYARCQKKGGSNCESFAFRNANGVLKNASTTFTGLLGGEHPLGRSFVELLAAEPPETINVFPEPGTYKHPVWGDIEVTKEGNKQFVENFNAQVYQEHVPIDAEHETKLSGAVGYIKKLNMNDDGSIEAEVEWTDRGQKLIEEDSYRYISPEWYEQWKDPATGDEFENVLIGAALTTRPFFKGLRSLVASEGHLYDLEGDERTPVVRSSVEGVSYSDLQTMVMSAARHEFPGVFGGSYGGWDVDLYDDYAIICSNGEQHYRVDYSYEGEEIVISGQPEEVQKKTVWEVMRARDYSPDERKKLAAKGHAMPDGSYPIVTKDDLGNAIQSIGRAKNKEAVKKHITKRAHALGRTDLLPDDWSGSTKKTKEEGMTVDVKDLDVTTLEEKDQRSLLTRLAASLKATVRFGHDPGGNGNGNGEGSDIEDDKGAADDGDAGTGEGEGESEGEGEGKGAGDSGAGEGAVTGAELTSLKGALEKERQTKQALERRVQGLEQADRDRRFRDIILGRDEASAKAAKEGSPVYPMVGDLAAKQQIMTALADTKGEASPEFKAYVAGEREHASQLRAAGTFSEFGTDSQGQPVSASPIPADALTKIAKEDPKLYAAYDAHVKDDRKANV